MGRTRPLMLAGHQGYVHSRFLGVTRGVGQSEGGRGEGRVSSFNAERVHIYDVLSQNCDLAYQGEVIEVGEMASRAFFPCSLY